MNDRLGMRIRAEKRHRPMLLIAIGVFMFSGCTSLLIANDNATPVGSVKDGASVAGGAKEATATTGLPAESEHSADEVVEIALGDPITVNGLGASVEGSAVRITAGGTYSISGTLNDGQIIVDTKDKNAVNLVLNGADITSASSAPIYVKRAKTTEIALADGTESHITDGDSYDIEDPEANEPNAAIFSKGNLTLSGNGSLTVEANYRNAITSKDELNITGGNITVNAANDGIRGRDYIAVKNGNITVNAKADGMQSNNDEDPERGFISIEGGTINITAGEDGIQAATSVVIRGGMTMASSGGGSANSSRSGSRGNTLGNRSTDSGPSVSAKGIKAVSAIKIEGGTIMVDSSDDAINSNDSITIDDGNIVLASGNNGMLSDSTLTINGGDISVTKSHEAIEAAVIAINGGNIRLAASDDGVSVAGGLDRANGRPGRANSPADKHLTIEGGYVVVDAKGDGIDITGWAKMTGGTVIVNGPGGDHDGALDYDREFTMAGGTQYSLAPNLGSKQPAGILVQIEAEDGTEILTFAPIREYQSVVYSSSKLKKGSTYNVYVGGSSTGSVVDGVYSGGSYTPGTRSASLTIVEIVTK